jgi:hypothetical protein
VEDLTGPQRATKLAIWKEFYPRKILKGIRKLIRKFGNAGDLLYVYSIKIKNMAKRLTQYEIDAIQEQIVSEIEASREDLVKTPDVEKMEKEAEADRVLLVKMEAEYRALRDKLEKKHHAFAEKKGLSFDRWSFGRLENSDQFFSFDKSVNYTVKQQIRTKIILSGLKMENLDTLISSLVKEFSK